MKKKTTLNFALAMCSEKRVNKVSNGTTMITTTTILNEKKKIKKKKKKKREEVEIEVEIEEEKKQGGATKMMSF